MLGAAGSDSSILIVDDHALIAEPLKMALRAIGFDKVHAADTSDLSADTVLRTAREVDAAVVLLDLHLGGAQLGIPIIGPLLAMGSKVVLFTASRDPRLLAGGLRAGAEAVMDKAMAFDRLVAVLSDLAGGRELMPRDEREALIEALESQYREDDKRLAPFSTLTEREAHVLRGLIAGDSPKAIARRDGISVSTVRGHVERILDKLDVASQREALALARAAGWPREEGVYGASNEGWGQVILPVVPHRPSA